MPALDLYAIDYHPSFSNTFYHNGNFSASAPGVRRDAKPLAPAAVRNFAYYEPTELVVP
jgi:hypothetical protein